MKHRPQRTISDLEHSARDIVYEIEMLIESASWVGSVWSSPPTTLADSDTNMALECFLLHYRNLRAFLCPSLQPTRPDDVVASDFLGKSNAQDVGDPNRIGNDKERLNRMLAHLSYSRHREYKAKGQIDWYVGRMAAAVLQQIDIFLCALPNNVKAWFPERTMLSEKRRWFEAWANEPTEHARTPRTGPLPGKET